MDSDSAQVLNLPCIFCLVVYNRIEMISSKGDNEWAASAAMGLNKTFSIYSKLQIMIIIKCCRQNNQKVHTENINYSPRRKIQNYFDY